MSTLASNPVFKVYVICSAVVALVSFALGAMTAARRAKVKRFLNPEDVKVSPEGSKENEDGEHPEVARIMRAHRNILESLPMFLAFGLIAVLVGASPLPTMICLGVFAGARVLHAIVYLNGLQPWRTMMFGIGLLSILGLMVLSILPLFG